MSSRVLSIGDRAMGRKRKLSDREEIALCRMYGTPAVSLADVMSAFGVSKQTVYNVVRRQKQGEQGEREESAG